MNSNLELFRTFDVRHFSFIEHSGLVVFTRNFWYLELFFFVATICHSILSHWPFDCGSISGCLTPTYKCM